MKNRARIQTAAVALALCLQPARAGAEGGVTFGAEGKALFDQPLKLKSNPSFARTRTNTLTSVATSRSGDYFSDVDIVNGSSTTTSRSWDKLTHSGNYLFLKTSYSSEFIEGIVKLGAATSKLSRNETTTSLLVYTNGNPQTQTNSLVSSSFVDLPQGFAYGLQLKGQAYQTEDFNILVDIHYTHAFNKDNKIRSSSVSRSTQGVIQAGNFSEENIDFEQIGYGLAVTAGMKLESFRPYLGLGYADGLLKASHTIATVEETYTNGALNAGTSTVDKITYILKPKTQISLVVGFNIPFDRGGLTVEGRLQGESSLSFSGFVAF